MYKAFLSHSSLDKPVVRKIKEILQYILKIGKQRRKNIKKLMNYISIIPLMSEKYCMQP